MIVRDFSAVPKLDQSTDPHEVRVSRTSPQQIADPAGCRGGTARISLAAALASVLVLAPASAVGQKRTRAVETGFATFYSRSFDGQKTASGTRFDADAAVAAHRTLPFGTVVRVTNLENRRQVTVRIIDRGPYGRNWREGTIIDLSPAAARRLGMLKDGQVRARVEVIRGGATSGR
jgi:rare lipoprotein A